VTCNGEPGLLRPMDSIPTESRAAASDSIQCEVVSFIASARLKGGVVAQSDLLIGDVPGFTPQIARLVSMMTYVRLPSRRSPA
jgi:hypothetical protein